MNTHDTRTDRDAKTQGQLVLHRNGDGRDVFCITRAARLALHRGHGSTLDAPAALPTMGSRIRPMNSLLIAPVLARPSMESTSHSAVTATNCGAKRRYG